MMQRDATLTARWGGVEWENDADAAAHRPPGTAWPSLQNG